MKSLDDESFFVYRNFASKTVTTGSITFTVPETESFAALSSDNYILTVIANGGSGTYSNGQNIDVQAEVDGGNLNCRLSVQIISHLQSLVLDQLRLLP